MAAASAVASILILNRWIVTLLGLASYGRVWQLFLNYREFGFSSRALVGSIVVASGLPRLITNEYILGFAIQTVLVVALTAIVANYAIHRFCDRFFLFTILFSPVLILQSGYVTGALDPFLLLLAALNMLVVRDRVTFTVFAVTALLVHELAAFTLPAQFVAFALRTRPHQPLKAWVRDLATPALASVAMLAFMVAFGRSHLDQGTYERLMAAHLPHAAHVHSFWSGYFEVARDFAANRQLTQGYFAAATPMSWLCLALPCLYVVLAACRASAMASRQNRLLVLAAALTPLLVGYIATDIYRWIGLAGSMGLLLSLVLRAGGVGSPSRRLDWVLAAFVIVAPFGAAELNRPFPVQQLVIGRLAG